jgi:predicted O-methyltransferase YrrM
MNGKGKVITLEGSLEIANIANETFKELNIENAITVTGPFHLTLKKVLEDNYPIDMFFNDGHHDHDAVIQYFNESLPFLSENAIVVFDDINWSKGMRKAWKEIEEHPYVSISIDLHSIGLVIVRKNYSKKLKLSIPLN